jgi:uncharacterized DUF497 family protein
MHTIYVYGLSMDISWDPAKAESNFKKHRIRFPDAELVLLDPFAMTLEDYVVAGEKRFVTVGSDAVGRITTVVYSYRPDSIRLISARKATPTERKHYEKGI